MPCPRVATLAPLAGLWALAALAACAPDRPLAPDAEAPSAGPRLEQVVSAERKAGEGITVVLDVQPDGPRDVPFTTTGKKLADFALDDDADPTLANSVTFGKVKHGTHTVQAGVVPGMTLQSIACVSTANGGAGVDDNTVDLVSRTAIIVLEKHEAVTCTFTALGGWQAGDFITLTQLAWGNPTATNPTLFGGYGIVYPIGVVEVGIPGPTGFSFAFNLALAVSEYLPAFGTAAPLNADQSPTASGVLGGEVLALQLNVDFADAGVTRGTAALSFGDLTLCALGAPVDGLTVRQFLALANSALGGGDRSGISLDGYVSVSQALSSAFVLGMPSTFAQDNLVAGACP